MNKLLDAQDELNRARDLVQLIAMTARTDPDEDQKAIATGCEFIKERFEAAIKLLRQMQDEMQAVRERRTRNALDDYTIRFQLAE